MYALRICSAIPSPPEPGERTHDFAPSEEPSSATYETELLPKEQI
jgi:hypothetical protein